MLTACWQQHGGSVGLSQHGAFQGQQGGAREQGLTEMITLYAAGPAYGLPEGSPYVTKTEIHLKMAGLWYQKVPARPETSPKGQLPWIDDDGVRVADSTFIRAYLERSYGVDLDAGLSKAQRAHAWAIERMVENHLAWASCHFRFFDDDNFGKGPARWFDGLPGEARADAIDGLLDTVRTNLNIVGMGRHAPDEIVELAAWSLTALSETLGNKAFMMGHRPTSVDAIVFAMLAQILTPFFDSPLRRRAEALDSRRGE